MEQLFYRKKSLGVPDFSSSFHVFNLNFGSVEYESPTQRKGIEAQTFEILLLRLCVLSHTSHQGYDRVLQVSFKIMLS